MTPLFAFSEPIRRAIYTTNAIESLNSTVRRAVRTRGHFPNDRAATKLVYLALRAVQRKWRAPPRHWHQVRPELAIRFGERSWWKGRDRPRDFHRLPTGAWASQGPRARGQPVEIAACPRSGTNPGRQARGGPARTATVPAFPPDRTNPPRRPKHGISDTPDAGAPEQALELVRPVPPVVALQERQPARLAEAPGADEEGVALVFQRAQVSGLVHVQPAVHPDAPERHLAVGDAWVRGGHAQSRFHVPGLPPKATRSSRACQWQAARHPPPRHPGVPANGHRRRIDRCAKAGSMSQCSPRYGDGLGRHGRTTFRGRREMHQPQRACPGPGARRPCRRAHQEAGR